MRAVRDHAWAALDVGRRASWCGAPVLVDLLAGGRRKGFCESPDSLYSVGFINIQPDCAYRLQIPASDAFYAAVSLHARGRQSHLEWVPQGVTEVVLQDGAATDRTLDTRGYTGMTQVMVRQYFDRQGGTRVPTLPRLELLGPAKGSTRLRHAVPAGLVAGMRFLSWRLKPLLAIKYLHHRLGRRFPKNCFLTLEDIVGLWRGAPKTVERLGLSAFRYSFCIAELRPGERLQIHYRPSGGRYFAFSLNNNWMQGLGQGSTSSYLSSLQLRPAADGSVTINIGSCDRGYPNFLSTKGHRLALVHFREIMPSPEAKRPACSVVNDAHESSGTIRSDGQRAGG